MVSSFRGTRFQSAFMEYAKSCPGHARAKASHVLLSGLGLFREVRWVRCRVQKQKVCWLATSTGVEVWALTICTRLAPGRIVKPNLDSRRLISSNAERSF